MLVLSLFLVLTSVTATGYKRKQQEPKVIKIVQPVHVIKVVKHIPPPKPVVKYVNVLKSSSVGDFHGGHGYHGGSHGHHGHLHGYHVDLGLKGFLGGYHHHH